MKILTAYYDLAIGPVSFDFVVFLVKAEMARKRAGADKLHMVIVPDPNGVDGMFRDKTHLYDGAEARWRLWNICIPACALLNASVTLATDWEQAGKLLAVGEFVYPSDWGNQTLKNRWHLVGDIISRNKSLGEDVPLLHASPHATKKVAEFYRTARLPTVTMTLRSTYMGERNSNRVQWMKARDYIRERGFATLLLEDVGTALENGRGYGELNLDLRMACYEQAALNLQSNNGTASLCWFGSAPYRMFDAGVGASAAEWDGLFVKQGLPLGATWPWALSQQKIVYKAATADTIIEEFEAWATATKL